MKGRCNNCWLELKRGTRANRNSLRCLVCDAKVAWIIESGRRHKYVKCGSEDLNHDWNECDECRVIRVSKRMESAKRAVETRRRNHPNWLKPKHSDDYWSAFCHRSVAKAISLGVLPKLDGTIACADCGGVATEYDHRDYSRPLDVDPCCKPCNRRRGTAKWPSAADYEFTRIPQAIAA